MKKLTALALAVVAAVGLSACSQNAQDQTAQAGNAIAADVSATTSNAGDRIEAGTDHAAGSSSFLER
ncbi:MAG: hypothetical protein EOO71_22435 [Myxococcaceae bacterium]|nr:MAG: hypothetical protein EOO71_22435 [Myxococcaceae bacterium]